MPKPRINIIIDALEKIIQMIDEFPYKDGKIITSDLKNYLKKTNWVKKILETILNLLRNFRMFLKIP